MPQFRFQRNLRARGDEMNFLSLAGQREEFDSTATVSTFLY
jgi:hypothetical protein